MLRIVRELSQVLIERRLLPAYPIHHIQVELSLIRLLSLHVLAIAFSHSMLELSEKLTVRCLQQSLSHFVLCKKTCHHFSILVNLDTIALLHNLRLNKDRV